MREGKVSAALKMLSKDYDNGVLTLDKKVLEELKVKHPTPVEVKEDSRIHRLINKVPNCYFDYIDEIMVGRVAVLTKGSGGPSNVDFYHFCYVLLSKKFKAEAKNLREKIALLLARTNASNFLDLYLIDSLTTCRLIPLNKNPGVRPISISEVLGSVIDKTLNSLLKDDIQEAAKSLQTMTGLKADAETAIYTMRTIFEDPLPEGVTLVDASSDFNSLNQKLAPHNIQIACPSFSYNLINSYRTSSRMIIMGGAGIQST